MKGSLPKATILVVDDEQFIRLALRDSLEADGYAVVEAASGREAMEQFEPGVDLVLLDHRLPDVDGLELLRRMRASDPDAPVIMLTAHSSIEHAVNAMREGAYHYAGKPIDLEELTLTARRALETTALRREVRRLRATRAVPPSVDRIIGESRAMRDAKALLARIATSPASTVLITGESGTGKDLAAQAIHSASDRAGALFLNITCSALPTALLESELFGHERGAFTDARTRKTGLLEHAHGGTVFLDEIGEMEGALQAKLLRFLEEKAFRRVGGTADFRADVRVIAATNVDLREAVRRGTFREDLYYRLAVLTVQMPPLRERTGDVELLVKYFIDHFNREFGKKVKGISEQALRPLHQHSWPGNVRELRNAVERAILLSDKEHLGAEDFGMIATGTVDASGFRLPPGGIDFRELEKSLVKQALERSGGNQTQAAALLGMNRDQIRYRIEKFALASKTTRDDLTPNTREP
jgi:DNA-binding NtrC family response regulator